MTSDSSSTAVDRLGGKRDGEVTAARSENERSQLAREAYDAAQKTAEAECVSGRGKRCRAAEEAVARARDGLSTIPVKRAEDSMATRISAVVPGLSVQQVEIFQPLLLPMGLEVGGFLMLALGLSPKRREPEPQVQAKPKAKKKPTAKPKKRESGAVVAFPAANDNRRARK
jgi:hypothetical protein